MLVSEVFAQMFTILRTTVMTGVSKNGEGLWDEGMESDNNLGVQRSPGTPCVRLWYADIMILEIFSIFSVVTN